MPDDRKAESRTAGPDTAAAAECYEATTTAAPAAAGAHDGWPEYRHGPGDEYGHEYGHANGKHAHGKYAHERISGFWIPADERYAAAWDATNAHADGNARADANGSDDGQ